MKNCGILSRPSGEISHRKVLQRKRAALEKRNSIWINTRMLGSKHHDIGLWITLFFQPQLRDKKPPADDDR